MHRVAASLAIGLLTALTVLSIDLAQAADGSVIRLHPGQNVITWNGAEPYSIAEFADTPVTQVHRWDAATQKWLSRFPGQDGATLPELHLLPRVQYLLSSEAEHELIVPDPIAGVDPRASLRFTAPPNDSLRFEAYWPNEDSPLEDLVVLRGEDRRLSVRAEVAGGVGEVSVWWMIDGRVNHAGLASDDVELLPGKHDEARLYAVDGARQPVVVKLPRVVKLPPLELPEMVYGVTAHLPRGVVRGWDVEQWYTWSAAEEAIDLIRDAGLQLLRFDLGWDVAQPAPGNIDNSLLDRYQRLFAMLDERGLMAMPIVYNGSPAWANGCRIALPQLSKGCWSVPVRDERVVQTWSRIVASRFPKIRYWQVGNEPNLEFFWLGRDPKLYVDHLKAVALGLWYENPEAVIVAAGIAPGICSGDPNEECAEEGVEFLEQMYEAGFGPYHDVNAIHYPKAFQWKSFFEQYLTVTARYGDGDRPVWSTEMGDPSENDPVQQGHVIVEELEWLTDRPEVRAAIIYNFRDDGVSPSGLVQRRYDDGFVPKASYWAVREFLTGQPKPD